VSRDLATVVATCLEKDRDRRYQTAAAVADDLDASLEGRPLSVRPLGALGRAARWARREPAMAALVAVLAIALPTIAALLARHAAARPKIEAAEAAEAGRAREEMLGKGYDELGEGDPRLAIAHFESADPSRSPEAALGIVMARLRLGDARTALDALDRHEGLLGGSHAASLLRADALAGLGSEAGDAASRPAPPPPRDAVDYFVLGERLLAEGHAGRTAAYREALEPLTQAVLLSKSARALYYQERAHAAGHARERDAAQKTARSLRAHWPSSEAASYYAGYALERVHAHDEAVEALNAAIALNPARAASYASLGTALKGLRRLDEAIASFEECVRRDPSRANWHLNLADAYEDRGRVDDAIASYREAIRLSPEIAESYNNIGVALRRQGHVEDALAAYREAVRRRPGFARAHRNLGVLLLDSGRSEESLPHLRECVRLAPDSPEAHNVLGRALNEQGWHEHAAGHLRTALGLRADYADAHANLGYALMELGRAAEAEAELRDAVRLRPDMPRALCNLGLALLERGAFRDAVQALRAGHGMGRRRAAWDLPSAEWVAEAHRTVADADRLEEAAASGQTPAEPEDLARLGRAACFRERYALASDWIAKATEAEPALAADLWRRFRFHGACASALAGCGQDAAHPGAEGPGKRAWRDRALAWLRDEAGAWSAAARDDRSRLPGARRALARLRADPRLAVVREPVQIRRLAPEEHAAWTAFWDEVARAESGLK
jgi:tetratricopeptide (TPR) repeat protein